MNVRLLKKRREPPPHPIRRLVRILSGVVLVLLGIVMLVTPGPGGVAIFVGIWLMSADVRLARRALMRIRISARRARRKLSRLRGGENEKKGSPGA